MIIAMNTMKTSRRNASLILGAIAAILVATAAIGIWLSTVKSSPPIRISLNRWIGYDTLWVAQQLGITAEEGVQIQVIDQWSTSDSRRTFEKRQVDAFGGTLAELLTANDQPGDESRGRGISVLNVSDGLDVMIAREGLVQFGDLRGKKVGVEVGSTDLLLLATALQAHGMKLEDILVVPTQQSRMKSAMSAGQVDAVCTYPPVSTEISNSTQTHVMFSSADAPGRIVDLLIVDEAALRSRHREFEALVRANQRVVKLLLAGDERVVGLIADREGTTREELLEMIKKLKFPTPKEQVELLKAGGVVHTSLSSARGALESVKAIPPGIATNDFLPTSVVGKLSGSD
jgi:NitT/TauT family transport system substrate-binding protein